MKTFIDCIPCIINQGIRTCRTLNIDDKKTEIIIKKILEELPKIDFSHTAPYLSSKVWDIVTFYINEKNPYKKTNLFCNNELSKNYDKLKNIIDSSDNKFKTAVKLAITGNIIDFGAKNDFDYSVLNDKIFEISSKKLSIDNSNELYNKLSDSKILLYLGDNNGEIIFDKIFIEYLKITFPDLKIFFAVRGRSIINDVTKEDAINVGMDKLVEIIDNGSGYPGTDISDVNEKFKNLFYKSDVVISKGQGNFETLNDIDRDDVYFLFMAKCEVVAREINSDILGLVCLKN